MRARRDRSVTVRANRTAPDRGQNLARVFNPSNLLFFSFPHIRFTNRQIRKLNFSVRPFSVAVQLCSARYRIIDSGSSNSCRFSDSRGPFRRFSSRDRTRKRARNRFLKRHSPPLQSHCSTCVPLLTVIETRRSSPPFLR